MTSKSKRQSLDEVEDDEQLLSDEANELTEDEDDEDYDKSNDDDDDDESFTSEDDDNDAPPSSRYKDKFHGKGKDDESGNKGGSYSCLIIGIVLGGIFVSMLPLYFFSPSSDTFSDSEGSSPGNNEPGNTKICPLASGERLFTKDELATFTAPPQILLAFLGVVYDVTAGGAYYQPPDGAYAFFAGKDGTRGFLTGEFTADELVDDVSDLEPNQLTGLDTWISLYEEKYPRKGLVAGGAYYDEGGCPTDKLKAVLKQLKKGKSVNEEAAALEKQFPPCNSEWNATAKAGRVWCSNQSGGVARSWTGKPRQFYNLATKGWRCACLREDGDVPAEDWCDRTGSGSKDSKSSTGVKYASKEDEDSAGMNCLWKHYDGCDEQKTECPIAD